jgi:transposase-like protein
VSRQVQRFYSTEFKQHLVQRIEAGERLAAVAVELGIRRKLLYEWRAAYRALGAAGLNRKRGPKPGGRRAAGKAAGSSPGRASSAAPSVPDVAPSSARPGDEQAQARELAQAKARIAELERVIGRQQVDLDFFRQALRLMDATPPGAIATSSTRSSKR